MNMNGFKNNNGEGETNGTSVHPNPHQHYLQWKVGLVNNSCKYLTAETFGFKINVSGVSLRKKQIWSIEHDPVEDDTVYIRSHLGRYMSGDKRGTATCESEETADAEKFSIQYHPDGSGQWAFKNKSTGYFLGGTDVEVRCYEKQPGRSEWWTVHLAIHPQVNLRNLNRQKFVSLEGEPGSESLRVASVIPWGPKSLITLEFHEGRYRVRSFDDRYLCKDGSLTNKPDADGENTSFGLEIRSGQFSGLALRDKSGKCLSGVGRDAILQAKNKNVGKDELFTLVDVHPQVTITAHNGKMVSIRQGVDPTANQDDEVTDKEMFQVEYDKASSMWNLLTSDNKFWSVEAGSGIQASSAVKSPKGLFQLVWHDDGRVSIRSAATGKHVTSRMNGSLFATVDEPSDKEKFILTILNKPRLVLKGEYGFVGFKSGSRFECNRTLFDAIQLVHQEGKQPFYFMKGPNDKYCQIDQEGNLVSDSNTPTPFLLELRDQSRLTIRAPNGNYLVGEQNGLILAKAASIEKATLWEY
ncbi:hypothetical protein HELRODRAFT_185802 [Helobdella robusta]|uniref:Fascin-like domain-containing protein n=1 Tax=Helobdella robusta TaxID=6412 RepID=T1FNB1_HELRO|nr:hypothetical protein HELRODRAFT_185802 [Helobdella robusta]ESN99697.1 hypothetical protein HELRODRAFT_185802 [Helobdella robusta]